MKTLLTLLCVALTSCSALAGKRVIEPQRPRAEATPVSGSQVSGFQVSGFQVFRVAKVLVYPDRRGEYRWRLVSANGRTIADSAEGYAARSGAIRALRTVTQTLPQAVQVNLYRK
jgi:uncharacterized protein